MLILQKAIQQSENKELITQNELANVIRIVSTVLVQSGLAMLLSRQ